MCRRGHEYVINLFHDYFWIPTSAQSTWAGQFPPKPIVRLFDDYPSFTNISNSYPALWWCHNMETLSGHGDVIKWKHSTRYWPFVRGIHRSPVNSPHKGHWRGALIFSLICVSTNDWVNNREAGDLRRHRAHYVVTVMITVLLRVRVCVRVWQRWIYLEKGPIMNSLHIFFVWARASCWTYTRFGPDLHKCLIICFSYKIDPNTYCLFLTQLLLSDTRSFSPFGKPCSSSCRTQNSPMG